MYQIEIANPQNDLDVDESFLLEVAERTLAEEQVQSATISIALVDNATIHELNRRYLNQDSVTDVLSFPLKDATTQLVESIAPDDSMVIQPKQQPGDDHVGQISDPSSRLDETFKSQSDQIPDRADDIIDGEIIISAEMAADVAAEFFWSPCDELVFYLVHGLLHLCGYDDHSDSDCQVMRSRERTILELCGVTMPAQSATKTTQLQSPNRVSGAPR